jgi:hypothetical protein
MRLSYYGIVFESPSDLRYLALLPCVTLDCESLLSSKSDPEHAPHPVTHDPDNEQCVRVLTAPTRSLDVASRKCFFRRILPLQQHHLPLFLVKPRRGCFCSA